MQEMAATLHLLDIRCRMIENRLNVVEDDLEEAYKLIKLCTKKSSKSNKK
jgi:hypothetical protein